MTPAATLTVGRGFAPAPRRARALPRERPRARGPLLRASEEEHDKARDILDADREKFLGDTASAEKPKFDIDAVGQELYDDFKVELAKWRAKRDEELKDEPPFVSTIEERLAAALAEDTTLPPNPNPIPIPPLPDLRRVLLTLVPIRPRRRGERRSLRTFSPGDSLRPSPLAFNPDTPRRLSTPLLTPLNSTPISSLGVDPRPSGSSRRSPTSSSRTRRSRSGRRRCTGSSTGSGSSTTSTSRRSRAT
jgi:hypothetical protein